MIILGLAESFKTMINFIGNNTLYNNKAKHTTNTAKNTIFQAPQQRRIFDHFLKLNKEIILNLNKQT